MTPEQLKASILQYAMEGKLVKQDPNDEPADTLLNKIKIEREELVKAGNLKKPRKVQNVDDEDFKFNIPSSWSWCRLGNIILYLTDGAHKTPKYIDTKDGVPFLSVKDISSGKIDLTTNTKFISQETHEVLSKRCNPQKEDILLTKVGTTGIPVIVDTDVKFDLFVSVALLKFDNKLIDTKYFKYLLESPLVQDQVRENTKGVGNKNWVLRDINNTLIVLPPLEEQKRIVAKIEKLMPLVDEYAESYNRLQKIDNEFEDKLKQSVLQYAMEGKLVKQDPSDEPASELIKKIKNEKAELIKEGKIKKSKKLPVITDDEKPFDIPDSWEWVRLGNIGDWGAGATPSRQHPEYYGGDILWLKTGDLNDGVIQDTSEKITEAGVANSSVKVNQPGNILIAMYGATIGKLGIVGKTLVTNQACCGCTPFTGIYNLYLFYYLLSARSRLIELGSGGAQPNISKTKIENFTFPLPPLEEQKRIVTKIERFMDSISNLSNN